MDPDPDPTPDPTPFFIDFRDAKKFVFIFFLNSFSVGTLFFSLKNLIFCLNFVLNFILQALFQSAQHFLRKGKDPDLYLWLLDPDLDPGGSETCGLGSPTLL